MAKSAAKAPTPRTILRFDMSTRCLIASVYARQLRFQAAPGELVALPCRAPLWLGFLLWRVFSHFPFRALLHLTMCGNPLSRASAQRVNAEFPGAFRLDERGTCCPWRQSCGRQGVCRMPFGPRFYVVARPDGSFSDRCDLAVGADRADNEEYGKDNEGGACAPPSFRLASKELSRFVEPRCAR